MRRTTLKLKIEAQHCPTEHEMKRLKALHQDIKDVRFDIKNCILQIHHVCNNERLMNCLESLSLNITILYINKYSRS